MTTLTATAIVLIAVAAIGLIGLAIWALHLKRRGVELTEKACQLADRAEALKKAGEELAASQKNLAERYKMIWPFLGKHAFEVAAHFIVTDEVAAKYKSEASVYNVAKSRLAVTIGNAIVRAIEPTPTEVDGKTKFQYFIKVVGEDPRPEQ